MDNGKQTNAEFWSDFEKKLKDMYNCTPEEIARITRDELKQCFNYTLIDIARLRTESHRRGLIHFAK